ncbi:MAG TPA: sigma-70 family RNA polymerase sigma factor [Gemmataceae bacterium]|jgi:RNA polymerase sigma factor (sigma-70 family)
MANSQAEPLLRYLHHLLKSDGVATDDGRLLERFVARRDEDAFAELVARHGPLVYGVCCRVLRDAHDAEDVFQAAFLVLARKAASIRKPESLSCFLHGVAYRLAIKARSEADKRRAHERQAALPGEAEEIDLSWREVRALIDEELQRLPEKQRLPLVLCYLEGLTQDEAAKRLGWPRGTLKRRLECGRERLRIHLTRRGVTLGAGLFAVALTESAAKGAVPLILREATVRAGMQFTTGAVAVMRAAILAKGALQTMLTAKLKLGAIVIVMLGCFATAAGLATRGEPAAKPSENKAEAPAQPRSAENKQVRKDRYGDPLPEGAIARLGTVRLRHDDMVYSVVFSGDGKTAIASDSAGFIVFWDVATGREIRRLQKMPEADQSLAITRDGKTLASAPGEQLFLWEVASGKLLSKARLSDGPVHQMLFTPDSKTLAMYGWGKNTIHLWDTVNNKKLHDLTGQKGNVSCMALSPDGKTLASGSWEEPHIRLWDIASGKEKSHFKAHERQVLSIAYSPDGKRLASVGDGAELAFSDPNTGKLLRKAQYRSGGAHHIAYAPDGKTLLGIDNHTVYLFDVANGKHLRKFDAPPRAMNGLSFSPDGKTLATFGGGPPTFDLWDVAAGKLLHPAPGHRQYINSLVFSADGRQVFSTAGITDCPVQVWDARTGERLYQLGDHLKCASRLALSPDGKFLAASGYSEGFDGQTIGEAIGLWELANRKEARRCIGHKHDAHAPFSGEMPIDWSADGKTLVSSSLNDKTIRLWDAETGKQRRVIDAKQEWPASVILSPDGKIVAAGGYQKGAIRLWSADTGKELRSITTHQQTVQTLAFSPDGSALASGGYSGAILLWEPATGRLLRRWEDTKTSWTSALAFARDGRTLVSGHNDGSVRLWEVATGTELVCFRGHRRGVREVAISRDSRQIVSGSDDTTILVWDATGGARPDAALSAEQLHALWADLIGTDAGRAYRAMWQMALSPKYALPFLAERLRPITPLDEKQQKQVAHLLADLDKESFTTRQQAEMELEKMGPAVEPALRKALEGKPSLEVRRRIEKVLEKVDDKSNERLRTLRALEAIEHMNTPEARRLLESLANGTPRAWLTEEARKIRQRLAL